MSDKAQTYAKIARSHKIVWHQTSSGINLFYESLSLVISTDHPLYEEVKDLIQFKEDREKIDQSMERLKEIIGSHKSQLDQQRVESLLGLFKK